jgi:hypothetical protein
MPVGESSRPYVVCPVCGHVFKSTYVSTYITVGREADLCPKIPGRPSDGARLIRSAVTMCPVCSFAAGEAFDGLDLTFDERYGIEERLKEDGLLKVFRKGRPHRSRALRHHVPRRGAEPPSRQPPRSPQLVRKRGPHDRR